MDWVIAFLIIGVGAVLALSRSTWIVDYTVLVVVLNRGIRRYVDWKIGAFNPLSPISLTPLVVACFMMIPFITDFEKLPPWASRMFKCFLGALGYAFVIGFARIQFAAIFALAEALAPFALLGYVITIKPSQDVCDRWIRSFSWCGILVSVYGWYQYLTIPPWDKFWLEAVGFVGYMGIPEPTKMTVFSTMSERGPVAGYLGFAVVPMILSQKWRTILSWPAVVLMFSVILLTLSRGGIIIAAMSTLIFLLINRGAKSMQIVIGLVVVGGAAVFGMQKMPNSERLMNRFDSLKNMQEDGSYKGRVNLFAGGWQQIVLNPVGYGLGATGLAGRVNTGGMQGQAVVADAGYFEIAGTYGWIGTGLLLAGLASAWKSLKLMNKVPQLRSTHVMLARAFMVSMIPACFAGNFLNGFSIFWLALGCALAPLASLPAPLVRRAMMARRRMLATAGT